MSVLSQILVFDRALVRHRRTRAASGFAGHNVLFRETESLLLDRFHDVKREFTSILDLGAHDGGLAEELAHDEKKFVVAADISERMLRQERSDSPPLGGGVGGGGDQEETPSPAKAKDLLRKSKLSLPLPQGERKLIVADEELLPFAPQSFDLVISNLSLHWINDLPGTLAQIKSILRPGGLFLATLLGGNTLHELRASMMEAELTIAGGISPRLSPTIELQAAAGLLQRAGFALPVADQETIQLTYADAFALMRDLRGMGEGNAHRERLKHFTRRALLDEAARLYHSRFADGKGRISAQFDVVFLHGWKD